MTLVLTWLMISAVVGVGFGFFAETGGATR